MQNDTATNLLYDAEWHLMQARNLAREAATKLPAARATRAGQLVDQIEQSMAWVQRISFYVGCDK